MSLINATRRSLIAAAAAAGVGQLLPTSIARAQTAWKPSRPIKVVVPWPPGGGADLVTRLVTPTVQEILGQPVIVENRAGASGSVGSEHVYKSPPDGHTLIVVSLNTVYPQVKLGLPFDVTKFIPVTALGTSPFLLLGRPDLPANNLREFVDLARKGDLNYANTGLGGTPHVLLVALGSEAKIQRMNHVPFQGMAGALQALFGNHADVLMVITAGAQQYQGKLKFLGIAAPQRLPTLPDVPTLTEQGVPLNAEAWIGLLAPPGTPSNVTAALSSAFSAARAKPEYRTQLSKMAMEPMELTQAEFAKYYVDDYNKWGTVIRAANIKLD